VRTRGGAVQRCGATRVDGCADETGAAAGSGTRKHPKNGNGSGAGIVTVSLISAGPILTSACAASAASSSSAKLGALDMLKQSADSPMPSPDDPMPSRDPPMRSPDPRSPDHPFTRCAGV
jgi:hypothetical protein